MKVVDLGAAHSAPVPEVMVELVDTIMVNVQIGFVRKLRIHSCIEPTQCMILIGRLHRIPSK